MDVKFMWNHGRRNTEDHKWRIYVPIAPQPIVYPHTALIIFYWYPYPGELSTLGTTQLSQSLSGEYHLYYPSWGLSFSTNYDEKCSEYRDVITSFFLSWERVWTWPLHIKPDNSQNRSIFVSTWTCSSECVQWPPQVLAVTNVEFWFYWLTEMYIMSTHCFDPSVMTVWNPFGETRDPFVVTQLPPGYIYIQSIIHVSNSNNNIDRTYYITNQIWHLKFLP